MHVRAFFFFQHTGGTFAHRLKGLCKQEIKYFFAAHALPSNPVP